MIARGHMGVNAGSWLSNVLFTLIHRNLPGFQRDYYFIFIFIDFCFRHATIFVIMPSLVLLSPFSPITQAVFLQSTNNSAWLVIVLTISIVLALLAIGYWVVLQLLPMLNLAAWTEKRPLKKKPSPQPQKEKTEKNIPAPASAATQRESLEWVKQEYPDALLMDAQTLVKEYQAGRRNFQSIYPTAVAPYETYFKWTVLDGIDLSRAMLYRAPFDGTSLLEANLNGAYLEGASLRGAVLRRANLSWADLNGADLSGADLTGANLSYASLQGADLTKAKLTGAIVTSEQLENVHSLKDAVMPDGSKFE